MLRLAVTPRWLAAALVLLVLVVAAIFLGRWQWDRTQSILDAERAAASQPIPVQDVFASADGTPEEIPADAIGRPVTAAGAYEAQRQVVVTNRSFDGRPGVWVVTGLRLADGSLAAVLRGWLPGADDAAAAVPAGAVSVSGVLQPDEVFYADAESAPGTAVAIASARLSQAWGEPVLPGFIVLAEQEPPVSAGPLPVPPTIQTADVPFPLQNFFYAFQWWIFAAFGVLVYVRWLYVESRPVVPDPVVTGT